ncbi:hypothetical protein OG436_29625 [Streptomyces caniferus]|uniref:hypothetical protein n=1 Tax=Streptomyces caniferus TaxID=285557 RepID=UPI002E2AE6E2|nr:hypothetical protein [Streptomyces caniferus]
MTEYKLQCRIFDTDYLTAELTNRRTTVGITAHDIEGDAGNVVADPEAVRTFARGLLALADEVDGGEVPAPNAVKVGDRFRVTRDRLKCASVCCGDVLTVSSVSSTAPGRFHAKKGGDELVWTFNVGDIGNGLERVDEPAPSVAPARRAILEEARTLAGPDATQADVLAVARFLTE